MSQRQSIVNLLPRELLCCILASSSDLGSLTATALSCRTFYSLFERSKESLIKSVLINRIGVEVLPEAILMNSACHTLNSPLTTWKKKTYLRWSKMSANFCTR